MTLKFGTLLKQVLQYHLPKFHNHTSIFVKKNFNFDYYDLDPHINDLENIVSFRVSQGH